MKMLVAIALLGMLSGCGVELLTTTAIQGELQAEQLKAVQGQVGQMGDNMARTNLQRAIDAYHAEKGRYPSRLEELVPDFIASIPQGPNGMPFAYDPISGKILDGPASGAVAAITPGDIQKMNQVSMALNGYATATQQIPPSLNALVPTYLSAIPKTDSGQDFVYDPRNGALYHPLQLQQQAAAPTPRSAGGGGGTLMTETMTGIGIQNQLNGMSQSGTSAVQGHARRGLENAQQQHDNQQNQALQDLGM